MKNLKVDINIKLELKIGLGTWEINQACSMRLVKSEDEEEESTMETLTRKREIRLFTKLLLPPTTTAIGGVDLGMSAEAQQEEAHAEPAMKVQASIIKMW